MPQRNTSKIMRSHKGKLVDIGAIASRNGHVITAGNMKVNARGDLLGAGGKVIKTREQHLAETTTKKGAKVVRNTKTSLNKPVEEMLTGNAKKEIAATQVPKFTDQVKAQNDKSSLDKFQVGQDAQETTGYKPNIDFKDPKVVKK